MSYVVHNFYCLKCGRPGIPIARNTGQLREPGHRKKLYCPWCKCEVNHMEICNQQQLEKFQEDFENGVYIDEAEESVCFSRNSWQW